MTTIEREIEAEKRAAGQFVLRELGVTIGMDDYQPEEYFTQERVREHIWWLEQRAAEGPRRTPTSKGSKSMSPSANIELLRRALKLDRQLSAFELASRHMTSGRSLDTAAVLVATETPVRDYVRAHLKQLLEQMRKDANVLARDLLQNLYYASSKDLFEDSEGARVANIESYEAKIRGIKLPQLLQEIGVMAILTEALDPESLVGVIVHYPWRAWAEVGPARYISFDNL